MPLSGPRKTSLNVLAVDFCGPRVGEAKRTVPQLPRDRHRANQLRAAPALPEMVRTHLDKQRAEVVRWGAWERRMELRGLSGLRQSPGMQRDAKVGQYLRACVCGRFPQRGTGLALLQWEQGTRGAGKPGQAREYVPGAKILNFDRVQADAFLTTATIQVPVKSWAGGLEWAPSRARPDAAAEEVECSGFFRAAQRGIPALDDEFLRRVARPCGYPFE